ncbi:PRC-barrel domain-containing protein [Dermatophilaceae bacterium Soc4.6]
MLYSQLVGTVLYGGDGIRVGQVRRVLLDEITGRPEWVVVSTGALGARQRLVPIMTADLQPGGIRVPYPAAVVLAAPRFDPRDAAPSQGCEEELYRHYAMDGTDGLDGTGSTDRGQESASFAGFDSNLAASNGVGASASTLPAPDHSPDSAGWDLGKLRKLLDLAFAYPQHQPPGRTGETFLVDAAETSIESDDGRVPE